MRDWGVKSIYAEFFGSGSFLAPEYLLVTLLIAYLVYRWRRSDQGFWAWALPRSIYRHRSCFMDMKLFVLGRLISILGAFNRIALASGVAVLIASFFAPRAEPALINPWVIAALLLLITDFLTYWLHRFYHEWSVIWPLHSVHHSAEVLTPITAYRQHPLADIVSLLFHGVGVGIAQGLFIGLFAQEFTGTQIAGVNAFFFLFALFIANFRHSHIWISFGPFLERIIISPAQHQIHHSIAPEHHNKNYGENFAIWDWMFGSLYIPSQEEALTFGLSDGSGDTQTNPHDTLKDALIQPLRDIHAALRSDPGTPES